MNVWLLSMREPEYPDSRLISQYFCDLTENKKSAQNSLLAVRGDLSHFCDWLQDRAIGLLNVDDQCLNKYLLWRTQLGFKRSSTARCISSLNGLYRWLLIAGKIYLNPCSTVRAPKKEQRTEPVLSALQVSALLAAPNLDEVLGVRDKAMLELLYATGLNVSELLALKVHNIDLERSLLSVAAGSAKDRTLPFGAAAAAFLAQYLSSCRNCLGKDDVCEWLFLNRRGNKMSRQAFWYRIKFYGSQVASSVTITPQNLRRAFAVHLLNAGGSLELLQHMMGHQAVSSTQVYRQISARKS